jgi:cytochrome c peroxidase
MASTSMRAFRAVVLLSVWVSFFAVSIEAKEQKTNSFQKLLPGPVGNSDYYDGGHPSPAKVELGRLLFFDKILSGNRNISCATCHHSLTDTGDGLSLGVGEGGAGLGMARDTGSGSHSIHERVPRNAPPVFNLGARQFRRMFHDGRVEVHGTEPSGFRSPADTDLPMGLDNVLAAQAMFPVTSPTEMAGQDGENNIATAAVAGNLPGVWELLAARLRANQTYVDLFKMAFEEVESANDITYVHAANAIAAFENKAWRSDNSPFDRYLRKERKAMSPAAKKGMRLFYGRARCNDCHSGKFQTDHRFHAVAMPQIGPGKGDGQDGHEDFGREQVTGNSRDRYTFRTPTLRNVAVTGPWGHDGAYNTLRQMVRHMLKPVPSMHSYDPDQAVLPYRSDLDQIDFLVLEDPAAMAAIADSCELEPVSLSEGEVDRIMDFLWALTDPASVDLRDDVPGGVPSGLPLAD